VVNGTVVNRVVPSPARRARCALLATLALVAVDVPALGGVVTATFSVGDAPSSTITIVGTPGPLGGEQFLQTVDVDGVKITWSYTVKIDAAQNRILSGTTTIVNATSAPVDVESRLSNDLAQPLVSNVVTGGTVSVKLVTDSDGGSLTCGDGLALVAAVADDTVVGAFFYCPFLISLSGMSSASTSAYWGLPIPSAPIAATIDSLGHQVSVALTPGDKAIMTMLFAANGKVAVVPPALPPGGVD
jgi:hypothetical protein